MQKPNLLIQCHLQQEELVVNKPNVLDQSRVGMSAASNAAPATAGAAAAPAAANVDVRKLTMAVMEEVHNQIGEITAKQKEKSDEQAAEIRKLKAMIVKHESRIRTLETKNREYEAALALATSIGNGNNNNNNNGNGGNSTGQVDLDLDPDEV